MWIVERTRGVAHPDVATALSNLATELAKYSLAALVHSDPEDALTTQDQIAARLNAGHNFAWIARRVTPQVAAARPMRVRCESVSPRENQAMSAAAPGTTKKAEAPRAAP